PKWKYTRPLKSFQRESESCVKARGRELSPRQPRFRRSSPTNSLRRDVVPTFVIVMGLPRDPAASRYEHIGKGLRRSDLNPDPIKQFANWFTTAIETGIRDVNATSLASASRDAKP